MRGHVELKGSASFLLGIRCIRGMQALVGRRHNIVLTLHWARMHQRWFAFELLRHLRRWGRRASPPLPSHPSIRISAEAVSDGRQDQKRRGPGRDLPHIYTFIFSLHGHRTTSSCAQITGQRRFAARNATQKEACTCVVPQIGVSPDGPVGYGPFVLGNRGHPPHGQQHMRGWTRSRWCARACLLPSCLLIKLQGGVSSRVVCVCWQICRYHHHGTCW